MSSLPYNTNYWIIAAGLLLTVTSTTHAQLSKTEKKLAHFVEAHNPEALRLLEEAVNINSGTLNFEGVARVGQLFRTKFDALGFKTRWVPGQPFKRAGHLIAEHAGKGNAILLIGHLDTVFEPDSPFQTYNVINDSTVSGPGVGDMKGGDVVIIQALQALQDAGLLKTMNITVVMSGDEELSGEPLSRSKYDLIEAAKKATIVIGFEDGDGNPRTANIARRSSSNWQLKITGTPSHSSQIFTEKIGAGAIYEASRILNAFYTALATEPNLTFNPGLILGGTTVDYSSHANGGTANGKNNVVAKDVFVSGDIRALTPEQLEKTRATMTAIVEQHLPQTMATITFDEGYPPMAPTKGNYALLKYFDQVSKDLGYGAVKPVNPRDAGAADISFTAGYVTMAMDGLGLGSSGGHTIKEVADPRTLIMQAKRTAVLLYRLTAATSGVE